MVDRPQFVAGRGQWSHCMKWVEMLSKISRRRTQWATSSRNPFWLTLSFLHNSPNLFTRTCLFTSLLAKVCASMQQLKLDHTSALLMITKTRTELSMLSSTPENNVRILVPVIPPRFCVLFNLINLINWSDVHNKVRRTDIHYPETWNGIEPRAGQQRIGLYCGVCRSNVVPNDKGV